MEALKTKQVRTCIIKKGHNGPEPALKVEERAQGWLARVNQAFGVQDVAVGQYLVSTLTHVFRKDADLELVVNGIVGLIREMQPQDALERMALVQIALVHHATMQQASSSFTASPYTREDETKQTCRLMRLFMQQMAAFRKYRNKASQNIQITHLHSTNTILGDVTHEH